MNKMLLALGAVGIGIVSFGVGTQASSEDTLRPRPGLVAEQASDRETPRPEMRRNGPESRPEARLALKKCLESHMEGLRPEMQLRRPEGPAMERRGLDGQRPARPEISELPAEAQECLKDLREQAPKPSERPLRPAARHSV